MHHRLWIPLVALLTVRISAQNTVDTDPTTINTWAEMQLGGTNPLYTVQACFPVDNSTNYAGRNISAPCSMLEYFFYNCTFGITIDMYHANQTLENYDLPVGTQQSCFCSNTYWEYVHGCNNCFKEHGGPENALGWIPDQYLSAQSSTYCSNPATTPFSAFITEWKPATTITAPNSMTTADPLGNNSAVSLYFTASVTATLPTQTTPIGFPTATATSAGTGGASTLSFCPVMWLLILVGIVSLW